MQLSVGIKGLGMPISETRPEPWAWLEGVDANGSPVEISLDCGPITVEKLREAFEKQKTKNGLWSRRLAEHYREGFIFRNKTKIEVDED